MKFRNLKKNCFYHRKLTLKLEIWHFVTVPHYVSLQNTTFSSKSIHFFGQTKLILDPPSLSKKTNQISVIIDQEVGIIAVEITLHFNIIDYIMDEDEQTDKKLYSVAEDNLVGHEQTFTINSNDIQPATSYNFYVRLIAPEKEITMKSGLKTKQNMESEKIKMQCNTKPPTPTGKLRLYYYYTLIQFK